MGRCHAWVPDGRRYMWNPLAWAMEAAAIISIVLLDIPDFVLIVALLVGNAVISYHEEANADKAIKVCGCVCVGVGWGGGGRGRGRHVWACVG